MAKNLSSREEVVWEKVLSPLLCCEYTMRYKLLMDLGFRWNEVQHLNLTDSPMANAKLVIDFLVDDLTEVQRNRCLKLAQAMPAPEWI